ncbi:MAG: nicotinate (nicotinamide) nucleotide adenylyltransferase [Oscillospiraceae bacterium]
MKLLLFGGTFDPPHIGHLRILQNAIDTVLPDKVVVMPAGIPPHKQASATPGELRLQMCQCFMPLFGNLQVSSLELHREGKSYTSNTVEFLQIQYPGAVIFLCIGSDMLLTFTAWHKWEWLLHNVVLVAQSRQRADEEAVQVVAQDLTKQGATICFAKGKMIEVSSTNIRQMAAEGKDISSLVPPSVYTVILQNNLYKRQKG